MTNKLNRLKDFFGYSTSEKNGILVLLAILLLTITINIMLPFFIIPESADFTEFKEKIAAFENEQMAIADSINKLRSMRSGRNTKANLTPFPFDPNNLKYEEWQKLGLKNWQIDVIINYAEKGGKFYHKKDLAKIYSISEQEFKILEPYIQIKKKTEKPIQSAIIPYPFDPNKISKEGLLSMNINENLTNAIINYRNKGGNFYKKEDLKKIYIITDQEFAILEPFILIETDSTQIENHQIIFTDSLMIDLNTADTLDLQQLKGIGPAFSKRIIKYRELLGGYCNVNQLLEVYGMDNNRFAGIKDHVLIETSLVTKININQATIKEMIKHPYIEFYVAKSIITYRNTVGSYEDLEEIKNAKLIYEELYQKIVPYLTTN